jgi:hypothetical protein
MGTGSKIASVTFRIFELISAAVVAGLVGEYLHHESNAHARAEPRLVYTIALAGISLVVCLICMIPLKFAFYGFVLDAILFIMWMTAFGLLVNVSWFLSLSVHRSIQFKLWLTFSTLCSSPDLQVAIPNGIGLIGAIIGVGGIPIPISLSINLLLGHQLAQSGGQLLLGLLSADGFGF